MIYNCIKHVDNECTFPSETDYCWGIQLLKCIHWFLAYVGHHPRMISILKLGRSWSTCVTDYTIIYSVSFTQKSIKLNSQHSIRMKINQNRSEDENWSWTTTCFLTYPMWHPHSVITHVAPLTKISIPSFNKKFYHYINPSAS